MNYLTAPVECTDELIDALLHAVNKVGHIEHNLQLRMLALQLQQRRVYADMQERTEIRIEQGVT